MEVTSSFLGGISVTLWSATAGNKPDSEEFTFTNPGSLTAGRRTFTAPANTTLAASTRYFVRIGNKSFGTIEGAAGTGDDSTTTGWTIDDKNYYQLGGAGSWVAAGSCCILKIQVNGSAATTAVNTAPNAPTDLEAVPGDREATLSWTAPSSGGTPTKYQYQQKAGSGSYGSWEDIALTDLQTDGDTRSYTVTGLTNDVAYRFKVRGVAGTLEGTESGESSAVTPMQGICRRTAQVRDKLVDLIPMVDNCAVVTAANLAAITGLDLALIYRSHP